MVIAKVVLLQTVLDETQTYITSMRQGYFSSSEVYYLDINYDDKWKTNKQTVLKDTFSVYWVLPQVEESSEVVSFCILSKLQ